MYERIYTLVPKKVKCTWIKDTSTTYTLSLSLTFFFFFFFTSGALTGGDEDFELSRGTGLTDLDAPPIT